jgi:hypothetical protein
MATLEQFLRTGDLGGITLGMTPDAVAGVLGPPEDRSVKRNPLTWKYGALQLSFFREPGETSDTLALIAVYFHTPADVPPAPIRFTDWSSDGETTPLAFAQFLRSAHLLPADEGVDDGADRIVLPSGAHISFDEGKLHSIQFARRAPKDPRKQLSVTVPVGVWEQVRQEARRRNQSVGEVCAAWIAEKVAPPTRQ